MIDFKNIFGVAFLVKKYNIEELGIVGMIMLIDSWSFQKGRLK